MPRDNRPLPPPTNNVYRVKVLGVIEEQVTVTTFFYDDLLPISDVAPSKFPNLLSAFRGLGGHFIPLLDCLSADWHASAIVIDSPTFPSAAPLVTSNTDPGAGPAGHLATQMAASLIKRTAFGGQCGRGRWALPAVPDIWVDKSSIITPLAYDTFADLAVQVLVSGLEKYTPILFSRNGSKLHPGMGVAALAKITTNIVLGTSRRRKLGVGI